MEEARDVEPSRVLRRLGGPCDDRYKLGVIYNSWNKWPQNKWATRVILVSKHVGFIYVWRFLVDF